MITIDGDKNLILLKKHHFDILKIHTISNSDVIYDYGILKEYILSINGILYENFSEILLDDIYEIQTKYEDLIIFKFKNRLLHSLDSFAYYNIVNKQGKYYINSKRYDEKDWLQHPDVVRYKRNKNLSLL